jgi:hypothetical protein
MEPKGTGTIEYLPELRRITLMRTPTVRCGARSASYGRAVDDFAGADPQPPSGCLLGLSALGGEAMQYAGDRLLRTHFFYELR